MFRDFRPERTPRKVRDSISAQQAYVDGLKSEMYARALVVADQDAAGRVDELARADYLAAREQWEAAAADLATERSKAIANNTMRLIHQITDEESDR